MNKQTQVTKDGLEALKKELIELVEVKRPKMVARLANARSQGDLSENSDYQNARDELEFLDGRIAELEEVIRSAVVVQSNGSKNEVVVGTKVKLKVNSQEHQYSIVGEWEANPAAKKISHTSPLGEALMGKKKGDKVEVEAPAGKITYEVLAIES